MTESDLTLRIEHDSGETSTLVVPTPTAVDEQQPTLASIRTERSIDRVARAEAVVFRDEWLEIDELLDRRSDEFFIEDGAGSVIFGGRFDDDQFSGAVVSVVIESFETDALETEPEASFSRTSESDDTIASDIIGLMPSSLSEGTVEQTTSGLDFAAEQATPGEMLRELAATTGADVVYAADGTVSYLETRGKTCPQPLSASNGAIIGEPRIRESGRESPTDVRVVSQSDPTTFADSSVTSGGRTVYRVEELDSTSSSRLQARADRLATEIADAEEYLEVETALDPEALTERTAVGDTCPVRLAAFDIDTELRAIEVDRTIDDAGDRVDRVLFANREATLRGR